MRLGIHSMALTLIVGAIAVSEASASGEYRIEGHAVACKDKGRLMFVERMRTGDGPDVDAANLVMVRDCDVVDEEAIYTKCAPGGFVFPKPEGQFRFSGYCLKGSTEPILYIRDDLAHPYTGKRSSSTRSD